ncbi:MAG: carboxymuconolactone decarboxylase family protein [Alphaproteobacteria bacterium]
MAKPRSTRQAPAAPARHKAGLAIRRKVLGSRHVDSALALAKAEPFIADVQRFITETVWGSIWTRPGLDRRTRSMINLAVLAALNRPNQLDINLRGALNNGVTPAEIKEVFLQVAGYCGAPAALDAYAVAHRLLKEIERERATSQRQRPTKRAGRFSRKARTPSL